MLDVVLLPGSDIPKLLCALGFNSHTVDSWANLAFKSLYIDNLLYSNIQKFTQETFHNVLIMIEFSMAKPENYKIFKLFW